jgi:hypothetical protein
MGRARHPNTAPERHMVLLAPSVGDLADGDIRGGSGEEPGSPCGS